MAATHQPMDTDSACFAVAYAILLVVCMFRTHWCACVSPFLWTASPENRRLKANIINSKCHCSSVPQAQELLKIQKKVVKMGNESLISCK